MVISTCFRPVLQLLTDYIHTPITLTYSAYIIIMFYPSMQYALAEIQCSSCVRPPVIWLLQLQEVANYCHYVSVYVRVSYLIN